MGRKKKQYIDKKNSVTFNLVHRSQNDPHLDETGETQHVLASKEERNPLEDHTSELRQFGIYYKDDYNYLQHLKQPGAAVCSVSINNTDDKKTPLNLPPDLFGTQMNVEGLQRVVPVAGPQPNWDPEILEAIDRLEGESNDGDCNESLDDDFVLQANGGELSSPVHSDTENRNTTTEPWWLQRTDYQLNKDSNQSLEKDCNHSGSYDIEEKNEKETARFTEYSMTSSVVPRSEGLSNLDDRFEEFMIEYNDDHLGPIEEERDHDDLDSESDREIENTILNDAVEEFAKKFEHKTTNITDYHDKDLCNVRITRESVNVDNGDHSSTESEEERDNIPIDGQPKWDCESILSTYSNLYNHPTLIKEAPRSHLKEKIHHSSSRDSLSTGSLLTNVSSLNKTPILRPKDETKEEQKLRKQAVKQERREHRQTKKAMKLVFKKEKLRQEREMISNPVLNKID